MYHKRMIVGLFAGFLLLVGSNAGMAAMWDRSCQVAIKDLQRLQQEITNKKQEMDNAQVVQAMPSNFVSSSLQNSVQIKGLAQAKEELKTLFHNMNFAVKEFSNVCLKRNKAS